MSGDFATLSREIGASTFFRTTFSGEIGTSAVVGGAFSKGFGAGKVVVRTFPVGIESRFWRDGVLFRVSIVLVIGPLFSAFRG
jgi:hypothetical protein